jgi:hypothetical protein
MDIALIGLVENAIEYVEDRYGRFAALIVAITGIVALIALPIGVAIMIYKAF